MRHGKGNLVIRDENLFNGWNGMELIALAWIVEPFMCLFDDQFLRSEPIFGYLTILGFKIIKWQKRVYHKSAFLIWKVIICAIAWLELELKCMVEILCSF